MTKIHVVTPLVTSDLPSDADCGADENSLVSFTFSALSAGPVSIECEYDEAMAVPYTVKNAILAEEAGSDAIVIDCFGDPGLQAVREVLSIPVVGPGQASMSMANQLGHSFSVVTVLDSVVPMIKNAAVQYGLGRKLSSVRSVGIPVLEIEDDLERLHTALSVASLRAIQEDGAHTIVLGCTGFTGCADAISKFLLEETELHIPVIDPLPTAVATAVAISRLNLRSSEKTYMKPRDKPMIGFET